MPRRRQSSPADEVDLDPRDRILERLAGVLERQEHVGELRRPIEGVRDKFKAQRKGPVYLCLDCTNRAHFGPMRLSHCVKSLINLKTKEKLTESHKLWSDGETELIGVCVAELEGCVNDLENQKRTDLEIMNATFEPLKNAVINRKRELTAQIIAHYDNMKPRLAESVTTCKQRYQLISKISQDIFQLDVSAEDEDFERDSAAIRSQLEPFKSGSIEPMLPKLEDGHRVVFPKDWNLEKVLNNILSCQLQKVQTEITDALVNSLTLISGDTLDVFSNPMDKDGIFWLKLVVPAESSSPLYQLAFQCRRRMILGKAKRFSDHPDDLHTGMVVMMNHPEDGVWYRAIVTDPCVSDKESRSQGFLASVVVADTGYRLEVPHYSLAPCSEEDVRLPLLAVPCSLYPGEHPPLGVEPKWAFNDLIKQEKGKPKILQAKFVHKKTAQHVAVPVWYVELTDTKNHSVSVNQQVEEKRELSSAGKGSIQHKDIRLTTGEIAPSKVILCPTKTKCDKGIITPSQKDTDVVSLSGASASQLEFQVNHIDTPISLLNPSHNMQSTDNVGADGDAPNLHQMTEKLKAVPAASPGIILPSVPNECNLELCSGPSLDHSPKDNLPAVEGHPAKNTHRDTDDSAQAKPISTSNCITDNPSTVPNGHPSSFVIPVLIATDVDSKTVELVNTAAVTEATSEDLTITAAESTFTQNPAAQSASLFRPTPSVGPGAAITCQDLEASTSDNNGEGNFIAADCIHKKLKASSSTASTGGSSPSSSPTLEVVEWSADAVDSPLSMADGGAELSTERQDSLKRKSKKKKRKSLTNKPNDRDAVDVQTVDRKLLPSHDEGVPSRLTHTTSSRPETPALIDASGTDNPTHCASSEKRSGGGTSPYNSSTDTNASTKPRGPVISSQNMIRSWITSPGRSENRLPPLVGDGVSLVKTVSPLSSRTSGGEIPITKNRVLDVSFNSESLDSGLADSQVEQVPGSIPPSTDSLCQNDGSAQSAAATSPVYDEDAWQESISPTKCQPQSLTDASSHSPVCTTCQMVGHTSDQCFGVSSDSRVSHQKQSSSQQNRKLHCVLCNGPHNAAECIKAEEVYRRHGCPYCLDLTHSMQSCSQYRKSRNRINFKFLPKRYGGRWSSRGCTSHR